MLVSLKWLSEYVPITLPAKELAERLSIAGAKVERIISRGDDWEGIRSPRYWRSIRTPILRSRACGSSR